MHRPVSKNDRKPTLEFLAGVLRAPFETGAIAPTSPGVARRVVEQAGVQRARNVVELGAGTGVMTREILAMVQPGSRVLALERDPAFASVLESRFPEVCVVGDCATRLRHHIGQIGDEPVDSIVSALPWSVIPEAGQRQILQDARDLLAPSGVFVTLVVYGLHWLPTGRKFRSLLGEVFPNVRKNPVMLDNMPPSFVYQCTK